MEGHPPAVAVLVPVHQDRRALRVEPRTKILQRTELEDDSKRREG